MLSRFGNEIFHREDTLWRNYRGRGLAEEPLPLHGKLGVAVLPERKNRESRVEVRYNEA